MDLELIVGEYPITVLDGPYVDENRVTPEGIAFAKELIAKIPEMKAFASTQLLHWAEDGEELSPVAFESNLTSPTILIYDEEGTASVYFQDSEMFGGHLIEIYITQGSILDAEIVG